VRKDFRCSSDFLYRALYKELERECREKLNYEWPTELGIDEHAFRRSPETGQTEFVTMIVDYSHKRLRELVHGKTSTDLVRELSEIPGRENVQRVVIDMCDPYRKFIREFAESIDSSKKKRDHGNKSRRTSKKTFADECKKIGLEKRKSALGVSRSLSRTERTLLDTADASQLLSDERLQTSL
jgi:hypothetical protein